MPVSSQRSSVPPRPRRWRGLMEWVGVRLVGRRVLAVVGLTLRAALRYRLIQVLVVLLLLAVVGLPSIIKHDGTAQGFTQILLTYTLGSITVLLGFATLWLGCGTLARDVEECQMQMVAVKPIARWEIWLGKWLGVAVLNGLLLGASGLSVYGLMKWRSSQLSPDVREELEQKVLVARGTLRESVDYGAMEDEVNRLFQERLEQGDVNPAERGLLRQQLDQRVRAANQIVPPNAFRRWKLDLGSHAKSLRERGKALYVRTRFYAAQRAPQGTFGALWRVGPPGGREYVAEMSLAPETFHEFAVPAESIGDDGVLTIDFYNGNATALLFPLEDGVEVLYWQGGFGLNFARGLGIIFCWLALLAAIGLATASFLSFPVAAFVSLALLLIGMSTGTLQQVIDEGGVMPVNQNTGVVEEPSLVDRVAVPVFKGLLWTINLTLDFSPVDALSTGRSVTWGQLLKATLQVVVLMGGAFAAVGIIGFTRRELATAQAG